MTLPLRLLFFVFLLVRAVSASVVYPLEDAETRTAQIHLPVVFEVNRGQAERVFRSIAHTQRFTALLESNRIMINLPEPGRDIRKQKFRLITIELQNAKREAPTEFDLLLPGKSNYFIGSDPTNWVTAVPQYGRVSFRSVYPGIDVAYHGNDGQMEYDFLINPGADPHSVQFQIYGADTVEVDDAGDLALRVGEQTFNCESRLCISRRARGGSQFQLATSN